MLSRPIKEVDIMTGIILLLGLASALDSFAISASVGSVGLIRSRNIRLPLAFGICDGLASLLGAMFEIGPDSGANRRLALIVPLMVACYAVYVVFLAKLTQTFGGGAGAHRLVFGLPLCLSVDNFFTGGRLITSGLPIPVAAAFFGLLSGLFAFAGLRLGWRVAARWPHQSRRAGLLLLFLLAVVFTVFPN